MGRGRFNGDPKKLAVAGGNLAVEVALAARDQSLTAPVSIATVYPVVQLTDTGTASYTDAAMARPLDNPTMGWFGDQVFAKPADKPDPRVALLKNDLKGLLPVTLVNAQNRPVAQRRRQVGGRTEEGGREGGWRQPEEAAQEAQGLTLSRRHGDC